MIIKDKTNHLIILHEKIKKSQKFISGDAVFPKIFFSIINAILKLLKTN
jgi:hypothetical protein